NTKGTAAMAPGARLFTRRRLLTAVRRVAAAALWLALFLALRGLTPIVPKAVLPFTQPTNDDVKMPYLYAFSPDCKLLVGADRRAWGPVTIWEVETQRKRFMLPEHYHQ